MPVKMTVKYRGFRDLKKYYVYRYGCPIKDVKKRRTRWREYRPFYLLVFFFFFFFFLFFFLLFIAV